MRTSCHPCQTRLKRPRLRRPGPATTKRRQPARRPKRASSAGAAAAAAGVAVESRERPPGQPTGSPQAGSRWARTWCQNRATRHPACWPRLRVCRTGPMRPTRRPVMIRTESAVADAADGAGGGSLMTRPLPTPRLHRTPGRTRALQRRLSSRRLLTKRPTNRSPTPALRRQTRLVARRHMTFSTRSSRPSRNVPWPRPGRPAPRRRMLVTSLLPRPGSPHSLLRLQNARWSPRLAMGRPQSYRSRTSPPQSPACPQPCSRRLRS